jgi:flagellar hook capping protein FlgD
VVGSTVYAAGNFTFTGGQARNYLAALSASTGMATAWDPSPDHPVTRLAMRGSTLYACGSFSWIAGQPRQYLAALDATTGDATGWNPNPNAFVSALAVKDTTVYVGGYFTHIGTQFRDYIAALGASTGMATPWDPGSNGVVSTFAFGDTTVYVGGPFSFIGGQTRSSIAELSASTGLATGWKPDANGMVNAIQPHGSTVYAGGTFSMIGGWARPNLAALDASTGDATTWDPAPDGQVCALAGSGSTVYVGGGFLHFARLPLSGVAAFTEIPTAIALTTVSAEAVAGIVRIRSYAPGDPIASTGVYRRTAGTAWILLGHPRPGLDREILFEDVTASPGTRYGYRLVVADAVGEARSVETWVDVPAGSGAPGALRLEPVRPNPLGGQGLFQYGVPLAGRVRLAVYDVRGRLVATVVDRVEPPGWRSASWDGRDTAGRPVASGTYFARLTAGSAAEARKVVVAR